MAIAEFSKKILKTNNYLMHPIKKSVNGYTNGKKVFKIFYFKKIKSIKEVNEKKQDKEEHLESVKLFNYFSNISIYMSSLNPVVGVSICIGALGAGLAYLAYNNKEEEILMCQMKTIHVN